jgi:hypothetical protein
MGKSQLRALDHAVELISGALREAVRLTIDECSPEPARGLVAEFGEIEIPDDGDSILGVVTIVLLHWLDLLRGELSDRPDRVEESLAWVRDNLGNRYRLRARCVSAPLHSADCEDEITEYIEGLGADFVPAMLWLVAGAVARYADGDADWLRRLQTAHMLHTEQGGNAV